MVSRLARLAGLAALLSLAPTLPAAAEPRRYVALASSSRQACAIDADGTPRCVGRTNGTPPAGRYRVIAVGLSHACAIREDGTLACWGSSADSCAEKLRAPAGRFTAIAAAPNHTCALRDDGTIACWGCQPDFLPPPGEFVAIGAGHSQACGIRADRSIACWGHGPAVALPPPDGRFRAVAVGGAHACAMRDDGTLACWGEGMDPLPARPTGHFVSIDAEGPTTCGVRDDGAAVCWGLEPSRRGADAARGEVQEAGRRFQRVAVGEDRAWGLAEDGAVRCLGDRLVCGSRRVRPARQAAPDDARSSAAPAGTARRACLPGQREDEAPVRRQIEAALRAPWIADFTATHGRPPRVGVGRYVRSDEPGRNTLATSGSGWSTSAVEVTLAREALSADGRLVPNACFFAIEDRAPDRWRYEEDCRWDEEQRFDPPSSDLVLEVVSEPARPSASGDAPDRRRAYSLTVRDVASQAVVWSGHEEVTLPCAEPRGPSPRALPIGVALGLAAGTELGPLVAKGRDTRWYGFGGTLYPVYYRLGCGGHEFPHCNYAALGASAWGSPWRYSVDLGLHEVGFISGSVSAGALFQPSDDGMRYGLQAAARAGFMPVGAGLGLRAWAIVTEPREYGVRLTLDLALYFRGPLSP